MLIYVSGMTNDNPPEIRHSIVQARWNPQLRHDAAIRKLEAVIDRAQRGSRPVVFTREDRAHIIELMGGRVKKRTAQTDSAASQTDERQAV